jgi:hypothetical protein
MKIKLNSTILVLSAFLVLGFYAVRAQQSPAGHASDFSSASYCEPPNQQLMKSRLSGAEAQPEAGGLLVIKQFRLEMFDTNGAVEMVAKAPDCVYDTLHGVASSQSHLWVESGDGKSHVEGDGFLWQQTNSFLTISNNVHTVIQTAPETKTGT